MSIKTSLYDLFAYLIPGFVYLVGIAFFCVAFGITTFNPAALKDLSGYFLPLALCAYIAGLIFDPLSDFWHRFFAPGDIHERVFKDFKARHDIEVRFEANDRPILLAYLSKQSTDGEIVADRYNAMYHMIKNISFGLAILAILSIIEFVKTNFYIWNLVLGLAFLLASVVAGIQSTKFRAWYYASIYEAVVAYSLKEIEWVVPRQKKPAKR